MLTDEELDRVCVVLVRTRNPNNIGAVARAMHDFGFRRLRLVNPYPVAFEDARSAVGASAVLEAAQTYRNVADAVADCTCVVGTTADMSRTQEHRVHNVADGSGLLRSALASGGGVALLLGSEKTGLSKEELSHCNWIMTIPMYERAGERHVSMNLGQAAAVCLYELVRDAETAFLTPPFADATAADLERLTELLMQLLVQSGYDQRHPANFDEIQLRQLMRRMRLNSQDAAMWMGMFRQMLWKMQQEKLAEEKPSNNAGASL